jgi:hypothetical protein
MGWHPLVLKFLIKLKLLVGFLIKERDIFLGMQSLIYIILLFAYIRDNQKIKAS